MTIASLFQQSKALGIKHSVVEELLSKVLCLSKERLFTYSDRDIPSSSIQQLHSALTRLSDGEPLAYITHEADFWGMTFYVDNRALIPRPETELLVEGLLDEIPHDFSGNIIDVGCGCGVIGISLVQSLPFTRLIALDIDEKALEVAIINTKKFSCESSLYLGKSDLLEQFFCPESDLYALQIDYIVANLPYIGTHEFTYMQDAVHRFEPKSALLGGKDGLDIYRRLFLYIKSLSPLPKAVFIEIGDGQAGRMRDYIVWLFPHAKVTIFKDFASFDRVIQVKF